ncbi:MAG TPA: glycosyltransferase family A protein [Pyrinomonadaceae bacterium]
MIISATDVHTNRKHPTVSVVIPAYNSARYITQALDSVKAQTFNDYEVIVVNDGSDDRAELEAQLASHPLEIIYISQNNRGVSAARNAAINVARGEFYAQIDADDQWLPDYLEVQLGFLRDNPEVALVYPNATIIGDGAGVQLEFMKISPSEGEVTFESLIREKCLVMTSVTARMNAVREAGVFDESLRSCEDFDLWLRMVKHGARLAYHRRQLVLYRRHEGSLSSDRVWMTRHLVAVFEKCRQNLELTTAEAEALKERISHHSALLALYEGKRALSAGGTHAALVHFQKANEELRSPKLGLVLFMLRHAPVLVIWAFRARGRLLVKSENNLTGFDNPHPSNFVESAGEIPPSESRRQT